MANNSIVNHMMNILDQYEAKKLRAGQVEAFFEQYAQALEGVSAKTLDLVQQRAAQLVHTDLGGGDKPSSGGEAVAVALAQLRAAVRSLLGESNPQILIAGRQVKQ